ncbi:MAG: hypothetical protein SFU25_00955, partial [Candidatus Caenarcaniphilales bacterium]|nr:hypothetical protein [Candidatus Caenarcaniphilales bacterium]
GFICRERAIRVQVESETQKILKVYQTETEKHYRPVFSNGTMNKVHTHGWQKSFSQLGLPQSLSHINMLKTLVSKHQLVDLAQLEKAQGD